jgi:hypothetical protein
MRAFNKETDVTYAEFRDKFGYNDIDLPLTVWISAKDMTDQEKKDHDGWETTEGYLKTLSYKEAWQEGWKNATQEQKDWYKSFPNFDAEIFLEITGIDVREPNLSGKKVKIKIGGGQIIEGTIVADCPECGLDIYGNHKDSCIKCE